MQKRRSSVASRSSRPAEKSPIAKSTSEGRDFVKRSSVYREFLEEREEILKHKWLESEKKGYDIGFERALLDWHRNYRDDWRKSRRTSGDDSN